MENFYKNFCKVEFDEGGVLTSFDPVIPDSFNFAYDVVDEIARLEPGRRAMVWCNDAGEEHVYTFADMRDYSNKAANLFARSGVKKGDMVMLVLKRHYQFWFAVLALHKLGAIGVPATNLLTVKDYVYRFGAAGIKPAVCTAEGEVTARVETACSEYGQLDSKFVVNGARDGWVDFDRALEGESAQFQRVATTADDPSCSTSPPAPPVCPRWSTMTTATPSPTSSRPSAGTTWTPTACTSPCPRPAG